MSTTQPAVQLDKVQSRVQAAFWSFIGYNVAVFMHFAAPALLATAGFLLVSVSFFMRWSIYCGQKHKCVYAVLGGVMFLLIFVVIFGLLATWWWWWALPISALIWITPCPHDIHHRIQEA